jgi:propionyl-CoA carboxylase alpha chain
MALPKKVLIANRGEIAVRVARTCRRLGVGSVAVYSDPDTRSVHVKSADEAVALGGATAMESYLVIEKILEAAERTGCDAVHPGYGFLSENPDFSDEAARAGLTFIGPSASAIKMLGDKMSAKRLATEAGVPTIPGPQDPATNREEARAAAEEIGYPVLIKPAAGGGGKGMRIVESEGEIAEALEASMQEAAKAFGDDRVFVERYIGRPRHIEIQVLADTHDNAIYLGERECSIQRRYQKIIEEAPSPVVDPDLRARMGQSACALARAAGYVNAGTVEFVLDEDRSFYFLEMNTRLQVEHPVTEFVTGLDLVECQLRVAAGERLGLTQEQVKIHGWAIETRVCAEDPERAFAPSTGPISRYSEPRGDAVRVDSGVEAGSNISVYYDSLLAKVIAYGQTREEARSTLVDALNGFHIEGPSTNINYANEILNHPKFIDGDMTTNFIAEHMDSDEARPAPPVERLHHMAIATVLVHHNRRHLVAKSLEPMAPRAGGVKTGATAKHGAYFTKAGDNVFEVTVERGPGPNRWTVQVDAERYEVTTPAFEFYRRRLRLNINGERKRFVLHYDENFIGAAHCGTRRTFEIYSPREWKLAHYMPEPVSDADAGILNCPMPGLVVEVRVAEGDEVHAGDVLLTLESMKMQSGVSAVRDARIRKVHAEQGQAVDTGDVLIEFET